MKQIVFTCLNRNCKNYLEDMEDEDMRFDNEGECYCPECSRPIESLNSNDFADRKNKYLAVKQYLNE